jgi:hypothetical protein
MASIASHFKSTYLGDKEADGAFSRKYHGKSQSHVVSEVW